MRAIRQGIMGINALFCLCWCAHDDLFTLLRIRQGEAKFDSQCIQDRILVAYPGSISRMAAKLSAQLHSHIHIVSSSGSSLKVI